MKKKLALMLVRHFYTTGDYILSRNAIRSKHLDKFSRAKVVCAERYLKS